MKTASGKDKTILRSDRPPDAVLHPEESMDRFLKGRLKIIQSRTGYRFSIDAILLADFATVRPNETVVDMGTGCGIIPLILVLNKSPQRVLGLEIQPDLVSQARRNTLLNGFEEQIHIVRGDIKCAPLAEKTADLITVNPPYRKIKTGRINPDRQRAIARHEILISLDDILCAARYLVRKKGRLAMIYPAWRLAEVLVGMRRYGFEPKRLCLNFPTPRTDAKLVLIEASVGGRPGVQILPPLIGQGDFSA